MATAHFPARPVGTGWWRGVGVVWCVSLPVVAPAVAEYLVHVAFVGSAHCEMTPQQSTHGIPRGLGKVVMHRYKRPFSCVLRHSVCLAFHTDFNRLVLLN